MPTSFEEKLKVLNGLAKANPLIAPLKRLGDKSHDPVPAISTGIYTLDFDVLGCGGIPKGRIIEVFGPESSGKTTFCLHALAQEQKRGELVAFVDAEHALDPFYARKLGVDVDNLYVAQPDWGEQALETVDALVKSRTVSAIVIDSVAALVPKAELDGDMGDSHMGLQARMMSQAMRKLHGNANIYGVTLLFINQIREKIGVMFGSPETTTGGRALKFYSSVRLDVRRIGGDKGKISSGDVLIGHKMKIKAVKNKVGAPFRETIVDLLYGVGFDTTADFMAFALSVGALEQNGAWLKFNGTNIGQGIDKATANVKDDTKLFGAIRAEVMKALQAQREADASSGLSSSQ